MNKIEEKLICKKCKGMKKVRNWFFFDYDECPVCNGKGYIVLDETNPTKK